MKKKRDTYSQMKKQKRMKVTLLIVNDGDQFFATPI